MFAVGLDRIDISPQTMKFQNWWIYDLQSCHSFWISKVREERSGDLFFAHSAWEALMKAYNLSLFSPLSQLRAFAEDYHQFFKTKISRRDIEKVFENFYHLGIDKIGHLKKLPYPQVRKRFGREWADFFRGLLFPEKQVWPWQKADSESCIHQSIEFDFAVCEVEPLLQALCIEINRLALKDFFFHQINIQFISFDSDLDQKLEIEFPAQTSIQKDKSWIQRILQERLLQLELLSPLSRIDLSFQLHPARKSVQLSLFEDRRSSELFYELQAKLQAQGYQMFSPEITASLLPEESWKKSQSQWKSEIQSQSIFRPLIQYPPRPIEAPQSRNYLTEQLEWMDSTGDHHKRTYYMCRQARKWIWVFQDEKGEWFEQGVVE